MTTSPRAAASAARANPVLIDPRQSLGQAELADLFPEGPAYRHSLVTFTVLLALAGCIAAFGLYQDSIAAIIGAMVVAPMGGAILAFAGALVTARRRWMGISGLQVGLGALMVVVIAYLISLLMPDPLTLTASLDARTSAGPLDLGVALAAGAAGAYVAVRRTGSDALPGVAIAVSLVPPLATIGICIELGRLDAAAGALLLFVTNFAAIVVSACIVFFLAGQGPSPTMLRERERVRTGFVMALIALAIISVPLAWHGIDVARATLRAAAGAPIVRAWVGSRDLQVRQWSVAGDTVTLVLIGPDQPGDAAPLAAELGAAFGSPVTVDVQYLPSSHQRVHGAP